MVKDEEDKRKKWLDEEVQFYITKFGEIRSRYLNPQLHLLKG